MEQSNTALETATPPDGEAPAPGEVTSVLQKRLRPYLKKFNAPDSDDEEFTGDIKTLYNVHESWRTLLSLPTCQKVMITEAAQKGLKIQVGVNLTQEFPWKQVQYKDLRDILFEELENVTDLTKLFKGFNPENFILIGFCPLLTESDDDPPEGDPFIFFVSGKDAKLAMGIIQNMEAFERWRMRRRLRKKPRRWVSMGTEEEMNVLVEHFQDEPVDVEIQSVYPIQEPKPSNFTYRNARDVRDGVIELLPKEDVKFENITRRRVTVAVQSAPAKIDREQQTNPTFPSNAWSQYLYEIDDADLELDESDKDEEEHKSRPTTAEVVVVEKAPPEMSEQIKLLLNTLEFNQIDGYRNDYQLISAKSVVHYSNPFLQEFICFANISKSTKRFVAGHDWYPNLSGLIAVSYTFSTPCTISLASKRVDWVQRAVLEPNPVLLWSFADNLNYMLEFEAPFEATKLSFCPFNGDLLFGGSKNGQVVVWDLQGRCERLDEEEYLTAAQAKYRLLIGEYLNWTIELNENVVVAPATITPLEKSPHGAITGFYWMSKHFYINNYGKVYTDPDKNTHHKFFITCAADGTISFWDLEATGSKQEKEKQLRARMLPKELTQSESAYKGKTLKPTYNLGFNEPVTSIIADTSVFSVQTPQIKVINSSPANYPIWLLAKDPPSMRTSMIVSTFYGRIHRIDWLGVYTDANATEPVNSQHQFAMVHDGPVVSMSKNPFYPELFASIGRNVFAVWKEDYHYSPIFWRKRPCDLTAVAWSETRPAVLYLTRIDGILEAWDILARDDDAVLNEILGGGIITSITEHKPSLPYKILGIGDYNSSIRMVKLPPSFDVPVDNELLKVMNYVLKQESRKISIQSWEQKYYELNKEIIEVKREAELEARKEIERIEREEQLNTRKRQADEDEAQDADGKPFSALPYNERQARLWDELNLNRMMTILMSRKQMDPEKLARETALEKERLSYEAAKKESHAQLLLTVDNDVAAIRARILPAEIPDMQRSEKIQERVKVEMLKADDYEQVAEDSFEVINMFSEFNRIDYIEFLERGRQRRQLLDQSLGGNTERMLWYDEMNRDMLLYDCNFGFDFLYSARAGPMSEESSHRPSEVLEFDKASADMGTPEEQDQEEQSVM